MRKRNVRYISRMIVKTAIILLPILICFFSIFIAKTQTDANITSPLFNELVQVSNVIYELPMNSWYDSFIQAIGLEDLLLIPYGSILLCLPLYFLWVEIFDLVLHLVFFFTDLFHKFLGGDK